MTVLESSLVNVVVTVLESSCESGTGGAGILSSERGRDDIRRVLSNIVASGIYCE